MFFYNSISMFHITIWHGHILRIEHKKKLRSKVGDKSNEMFFKKLNSSNSDPFIHSM